MNGIIKKSVFILLFTIFSSLCFAQKKYQYGGRVDIGWGSDFNLTKTTSHGIYLNPKLFVGLGLGIDFPIFPHEDNELHTETQIRTYPVFGEIQYNFLQTRFTPIVLLKICAENRDVNYTQFDSKTQKNKRTNVYYLAGSTVCSLGVHIRFVKKFGMRLLVSGHFRTSQKMPVHKESFSFSVGLEF